MSYEYFNDIESDLYKLHSMVEIAGDSVPDMVAELKEVYAKAQAFDEIVRCMEYQQAYDLTDSMVMQDIDYAIRKVFTEDSQ